MSLADLWHYTRPDLTFNVLGKEEALVSWVAWCYLAWCPPMFTFARFAGRSLTVYKPSDLVQKEGAAAAGSDQQQ